MAGSERVKGTRFSFDCQLWKRGRGMGEGGREVERVRRLFGWENYEGLGLWAVKVSSEGIVSR